MAKTARTAADFIAPLNVNGLKGRMLKLPPPKNRQREILFIYGHHSSLERWWGLMQNLNRYGGVTMPDLPGFGGMESLYKLGKPATIDNLADYLAAFIKFRYKRRRFTIVGMSVGFTVVTRMLQRYPELTKQVDLLVSSAGFAHRDDFTFSRPRWICYYIGASIFGLPGFAGFFRHVVLHPYILRTFYRRTHNAKNKFKGATGEELQALTDFEVRLWHDNDVRTYMKTTTEILTLDNCRQRVELPVYHVAIKADHFFDNNLVEQHMRVIFQDFHVLAQLEVGNHAPSVLADAKAAAPYVPPKLQRVLNKIV